MVFGLFASLFRSGSQPRTNGAGILVHINIHDVRISCRKDNRKDKIPFFAVP